LKGKLGIQVKECSTAQKSILKNRWPNKKMLDSQVLEQAQTIIEDVRKRGDAALAELTARFDKAEVPQSRLRVDREAVEQAYEKMSDKQVSALEFAKKRVEGFQRKLLRQLSFEYEFEEVKIHSYTSPVRRLGCYVPGGEAAYPSSLIMAVTPAKVAGVPEIAVCSPPRYGGEINPAILVAADICGVDEIYRVGGVQAVAAMVYGTKTIKPVDKLVGPGNKYVVAAKMLASQDLPIDTPAGPSEIIVLADESADPNFVALDMASQAEHLGGVAVLVTTSRRLVDSAVKKLKQMIDSLPNRDMVIRNLTRNGLILVCRDMDEAVGFVNAFAPEHLQVLAKSGWSIAEQVTSAGLILVGAYTPVAASDYCLGTVHILPTEGFSHVYSGLSALDFVKRFSIVECSKKGLSKVKPNVKVLAEAEGLVNHALAVEGRFRDA
jgi:histidinol dehydrogenase